MSQSVIPTFDRMKAKAKLQDSGKSQAEVARDLGYERQTVGHWLRGRSDPDMQQLAQLARSLGCHWLELVNDEATVINDPEEARRVQRIRKASPERRALIDAILADAERLEDRT